MIGWLMGLPFRAIAKEITKAITARENAQTERERIAAGSGEKGLTGPTTALSLEPTRLDGNNVNLDTETLQSV